MPTALKSHPTAPRADGTTLPTNEFTLMKALVYAETGQIRLIEQCCGCVGPDFVAVLQK